MGVGTCKCEMDVVGVWKSQCHVGFKAPTGTHMACEREILGIFVWLLGQGIGVRDILRDNAEALTLNAHSRTGNSHGADNVIHFIDPPLVY